jgi:hypothetical protein
VSRVSPVLDWRPDAPVVGYHQFHPDASVNFQCNRWVQWLGAEAIPEVAALADRAGSYPQWIDGFLSLATTARGQGRVLAAAYYDRAAEFFMAPMDPRRPPARARFLADMRGLYDVTPIEIPYLDGDDSGRLPGYDLHPDGTPVDTALIFGGFDGYIE